MNKHGELYIKMLTETLLLWTITMDPHEHYYE